MTREETKELLMMIKAVYPNFDLKPEQMTATINAWSLMLEEYPANAITGALKIYVKTNNTGFPPTVSQLIGCAYKPTENEQLTEGEAWFLVKQAMQGANYHAEENFEKLPPIVRRAVGGASMLRQWGMTDSDEVNTVVMSNFQRTYRAIVSKQDFNNKVPTALSDLVKGIAEKVSPENRIGVWNDEENA